MSAFQKNLFYKGVFMVATLEKGVKDVVVAVVANEERLVAENKTVLRGAADAINGLSPTGMDSVYGKILDDMCP